MKEKSLNFLKIVRVILAIIIFTPIVLFFVDFTDILPHSLSRMLEWQLMPAILSFEVTILIVLFLLTLTLGRVYCSIICPAGVLQDIFNRISCIGKKKKNGKMRFRYHKPANLLRYILLGTTAMLAVFGVTELCLYLDPYSNFGRISANIFHPIVVWANNILAGILSSKGNYSLYNVSLTTPTVALTSGIIAFVVFAVMVYFRGRLFCNTICPVGALLSIVSRYSLFRISIETSTCNNCKSCERSCKAEAIDSANMKVDISRCISCFNCTSSCNKSAIKYRFAPSGLKRNITAVPATSETSALETSKSRRSFITTSATLAGAAPLYALAQNKTTDGNKKLPVTPPGSLNIEQFKNLCTGCHLCVIHCPTHILKPAGLQYGFDYMLKPYMSFDRKYCNFSCIACSQVCPSDAIKPISVDEKKVTQIGIAEFYIDKCVVKTDNTDCGACSEHCPTQAVHMVPYKGTLTIPKVEPELCVGCGGCESICPVRPERAIVIISNPVHQTAKKPKEEEVREVNIDDFGF